VEDIGLKGINKDECPIRTFGTRVTSCPCRL
jgi:hypothetical protein